MNYSRSEQYSRVVAQQLRAELAAHDLRVIDIVKRAGIPRVSLDRWLKGDRPLTVANLYRVCAGIGIDPRIVIARASERFHETSGPGATIPGDAAHLTFRRPK